MHDTHDMHDKHDMHNTQRALHSSCATNYFNIVELNMKAFKEKYIHILIVIIDRSKRRKYTIRMIKCIIFSSETSFCYPIYIYIHIYILETFREILSGVDFKSKYLSKFGVNFPGFAHYPGCLKRYGHIAIIYN